MTSGELGLLSLVGLLFAHWLLIFYLMWRANGRLWRHRRRRYTFATTAGVVVMLASVTIYEQSGGLA